MTSRRDVLQLFLGAPLAVAACKRKATAAPVPGVLVDALEKQGHRLRDEACTHVPEAHGEVVDVLIVGGGIAGLAARARLAASGLRVVLLDADAVTGGTSKSGENQGGKHPWGAHYITAPLPEARPIVRLLEELGVVTGRLPDGEPVLAEEAVVRAPEERLFHLGRWEDGLYPRAGASAEDLEEFGRFRTEVARWAVLRDGRGRRAFIAPLGLASDDATFLALDTLTMSEWLLREGYRSPRLRWLIDYACRDDFGLRVEQASAWAGLFYFAARLGADGTARAVIPWPEGNGRLAAHLLAKGRGAVHSKVFVRRVIPGKSDAPSDAPVVATVVAEDASGVLAAWRARRVLMAIPSFIARRVVDGFAAHAGNEPVPSYGSWVVANVVVRRDFEREEPSIAWDNVIHRSPSLGYVHARHQLDGHSDYLTLTHYYALCDDDPKAVREKLLAIDHARWCDVVLSDLEVPHPRIRDHVVRIDVQRWGHAMVRPVPGARTNAARAGRPKAFHNVYFAHTEQSAIALFEEAYWQGIRGAEDMLASLSMESPSELTA